MRNPTTIHFDNMQILIPEPYTSPIKSQILRKSSSPKKMALKPKMYFIPDVLEAVKLLSFALPESHVQVKPFFLLLELLMTSTWMMI